MQRRRTLPSPDDSYKVCSDKKKKRVYNLQKNENSEKSGWNCYCKLYIHLNLCTRIKQDS